MSLLPKTQKQEAPLSPGDLVVFEESGEALTGIITGYQKLRYLIESQSGDSLSLPSARMWRLLQAEGDAIEESRKKLSEISLLATKIRETFQAEELWKNCVEKNKEYTVPELSELMFAEVKPEFLLALFLELREEQVFFARKKLHFLPRKTENVEQLQKEEEAKRERQRVFAKELESLNGNLEKESVSHELSELIGSGLIGKVLEFASGNPNLKKAEQKRVSEFIDFCQENSEINMKGSPQQKALHLLTFFKVINRFSDLSSIKHDIHLLFSKDSLEEAREVSESLKALSLKEATLDYCVTIDDSQTQDMDDAVSITRRDNKVVLGIHIANVALALEGKTALFREALSRATSVYLPIRNFHMLPEILSTDALSLHPGILKPVISCYFTIPPSGEIEFLEWKAESIRSKEKLSYDEVNSALSEGHPELSQIHEATGTYEQKRIEAGAFKLPRKELGVRFDNEEQIATGQFEITEFDEASLSRNMIGELMILYNSTAAEFARRNKFPLLFRKQGEKEDKTNEHRANELPEGAAKDYALRGTLARSETSTEPGKHKSLALDAYAQLTSPIRRFSDLLNQQQLLSYLRLSKPLYSDKQLLDYFKMLDDPLSRAGAASRESKKFWILHLLERFRKEKKVLEATVVRNDMKYPLVELSELGFITTYTGRERVKLGENFDVKVSSSNPRKDRLFLERVKK